MRRENPVLPSSKTNETNNLKICILQIILGLIILSVCTVAQFSSVLTPFLAESSSRLYLFSFGGLILFCLAALIASYYSLTVHKPKYYFLAILYLLSVVFISQNVYGRAFQFGLAGLTIGGSLLILGSINTYKYLKNPS